MRKQILAGFLFLGLGFAAWGEQLSFRSAADQMVKSNPALAQKRLQKEGAMHQKSQSQATYFPRLDFVQSYSRSNNPVFVFGTLLNQQRFSEANFAIDSLNQPEAISDNVSKFQAGWLLFDFGGREAGIRSTDAGYRISMLSEDVTRAALFQELVRRYYGVSLAQQRLETARENLKSAESRHQQAVDRVKQGLAVATESLSAEVFVSRKKQEVLDSENGVRLARAALGELLGGIDVSDSETSALVMKDYDEKELNWWIATMTERRPELKMAAEGRRLASSGVTGVRSSFLPSLQAWSAYEWHGESLDYSGENWGAGVELKWNLFRGMADSSQYSQARLREKEAVERQREVENGLRLQVESAYYSFRNAKEKLKVGTAVLDQAEENRRIHAERYAEGLVSIQDSLQAEASRAESRLLVLQNLYDLYVTHAELLASAGIHEEIVSEE